MEQRFSGNEFTKLNKVYDFVQYIDQSSLSTPGPLSALAAGTSASYYFTFGMLAQNATFSALFDQYKIVCIEMRFQPRVSVIDAVSKNSGDIYSYVDLDDAATVAITVAQQRNNTIVVPGYRGFTHTWRPHVALTGLQNGFTSGGVMNVPSRWFDTLANSSAHYGVKTVWTAVDAVSEYAYDIFTRVHIQFRNVQ
jgi:hypothetical protein